MPREGPPGEWGPSSIYGAAPIQSDANASWPAAPQHRNPGAPVSSHLIVAKRCVERAHALRPPVAPAPRPQAPLARTACRRRSSRVQRQVRWSQLKTRPKRPCARGAMFSAADPRHRGLMRQLQIGPKMAPTSPETAPNSRILGTCRVSGSTSFPGLLVIEALQAAES